jgi:hypothetical protein
MSLEKELARRRFQASAKDIQRRHRKGQEAAKRLVQMHAQHGGPDGVHPNFRAQLDAAAKKVRDDAQGEGRPDLDNVIDRLRAEGKLPPAVPSDDVGYEPTPEEVLGDLAVSRPLTEPEQLESVPSADQVLSSDPVMFEQLNPALRGAIESAAQRLQAKPVAPSGRVDKNKRRRNHR